MIQHELSDGSVLELNIKIGSIFELNIKTEGQTKHLIVSGLRSKAKQGVITIPRSLCVEGENLNIEGIGSEAFCNVVCDEMVLPNTIRYFQNWAFFGATIHSLTIPSSINDIPARCFLNAEIDKITFAAPGNIRTVGDMAFSQMKGLKELNWPSGCKEIPFQCFQGSTIRKIKELEGVEYIGSGAFELTPHLQSISWPETCKIIPSCCFRDSAIRSIDGIENVEEVGVNAFFRTKKLKSMVWPKHCATIPMCCFQFSSIETITGTDGIKTIEMLAFYGTNLQDISLPQVSSIGMAAFLNSNLSEASLGGENPDKLAFYNDSFPENLNINVNNYQEVDVLKGKNSTIPIISGSFDTGVCIEE